MPLPSGAASNFFAQYYYTKTELNAGQLNNLYFTESEHINTSAGAGDAGKPIKLDAAGHIDATMINDADIDHGTTGGLTDDDHTQYTLLAGRSGGQTLTGGTASGNNLLLQSTSNATKGTVRVNENGSSFGMGDGTNASVSISFASGRGYIGYNGSNDLVVQGGSSKGILFNVNNATFGSGNVGSFDTSGNFVATGTITGTQLVNATHTHAGASTGGQIAHTALTSIGTNTHAQIDTHIAATTGHGATGAVVGTTNTQTLSGKTFSDQTNFSATGKSIALGSANVSTHMDVAGTRGYFGYDGTNTVVQGGTSKGISFNVNNATFGSGTVGSFDTSGNFNATGTITQNSVAVVTTSGTQTLTNKTLTAPTINGVVGGTMTSATITTATIPTITGPTNIVEGTKIFIFDPTDTTTSNPKLTAYDSGTAGTCPLEIASSTLTLNPAAKGLILSANTTPSSATDTGTAGAFCWDSSYVYVCTATNVWGRAALAYGW